MSRDSLEQQLIQLRQHLEEHPPERNEDREALVDLIRDIELRLAHQDTVGPDNNLVDGVNLAVERFEVSHPRVAGTLRSIMQSLVGMGV